MQEIRTVSLRHGLTFYGTVAFVAAFLGARLFATLNPTVVVVRGGIHFHHFWYGLAMITATGWIGITTLRNDQLTRQLAIIFGLGAGLIGDEVGLLLTFGDYTSNLTEIFFVSAIAFIILATLISRGRKHIERDVLNVSGKERLTQIGVFIGAFSVLFFAVQDWTIGLLFLGLGILVYFWGIERERRPRRLDYLPRSSRNLKASRTDPDPGLSPRSTARLRLSRRRPMRLDILDRTERLQ